MARVEIMRVAIHYNDGRYCFYDPSTHTMADGVDREEWMKNNTVTISEAEWTAYQVLEVQDRLFQDRIAALSNSYFDR